MLSILSKHRDAQFDLSLMFLNQEMTEEVFFQTVGVQAVLELAHDVSK